MSVTQVWRLPPKTLFFAGGERKVEKLGMCVSQLAKDINQQNCVAASINV